MAVPRVPTFNHQVYTDVFWVKGVMFLHMVCAFSAYRQAAILTKRAGRAVVSALLNFWIRYLGPMKSLRIELGSEFDNKDVTELAERYGIEVDPNPGGAQWAGGVIEAQRGTLRTALASTLKNRLCWPDSSKDMSPLRTQFVLRRTVRAETLERADEVDDTDETPCQGWEEDTLEEEPSPVTAASRLSLYCLWYLVAAVR